MSKNSDYIESKMGRSLPRRPSDVIKNHSNDSEEADNHARMLRFTLPSKPSTEPIKQTKSDLSPEDKLRILMEKRNPAPPIRKLSANEDNYNIRSFDDIELEIPPDLDTYEELDICADTNTDTDANTDINTHTHMHTETYSNSSADTKTNTEAYSNADSDTELNLNLESDLSLGADALRSIEIDTKVREDIDNQTAPKEMSEVFKEEVTHQAVPLKRMSVPTVNPKSIVEDLDKKSKKVKFSESHKQYTTYISNNNFGRLTSLREEGQIDSISSVINEALDVYLKRF